MKKQEIDLILKTPSALRKTLFLFNYFLVWSADHLHVFLFFLFLSLETCCVGVCKSSCILKKTYKPLKQHHVETGILCNFPPPPPTVSVCNTTHMNANPRPVTVCPIANKTHHACCRDTIHLYLFSGDINVWRWNIGVGTSPAVFVVKTGILSQNMIFSKH